MTDDEERTHEAPTDDDTAREEPARGPTAEAGFAFVRRNQLVSFVAVTLALSWGWWAFAHVVIAGGSGLSRGLLVPGAFGPPLAGAVVTWGSGGDVVGWLRGLLRWRVRKRWYAAALLLSPLLALGPAAALAAAGVALDPSVLPVRGATFPVVLVAVLLVGGGQEEPGWRGFALPRLQARFGALAASVLLGVTWAVWHLPLFLFGAPRTASGSFLAYVAMVVPVTVVLTWLYNESGGSVVLTAVAHAAVNASGILVPVARSSAGQAPLASDLSVAALAGLLAVTIVLRHGPETLATGPAVTETSPVPDGSATATPNVEAAD